MCVVNCYHVMLTCMLYCIPICMTPATQSINSLFLSTPLLCLPVINSHLYRSRYSVKCRFSCYAVSSFAHLTIWTIWPDFMFQLYPFPRDPALPLWYRSHDVVIRGQNKFPYKIKNLKMKSHILNKLKPLLIIYPLNNVCGILVGTIPLKIDNFFCLSLSK